MTEKVFRTESRKITLSLGNYEIEISKLPNGQVAVTVIEIVDGYSSDVESTIYIPPEFLPELIKALTDIN